MKKLYALALASTALFTACGDDDDPSGPGNGDSGYTATLTGLPGLTQSSGDAFWTEGTEQGVTSFVIGLQPSGSQQVGFLFFRGGAGRAAVGEYAFVSNDVEAPPEQFQMIAMLTPSGGSFLCGAMSGTLRISGSSNSGVSGTFTIQGQCASTTTEEPPFDVTIAGTYNAVNRSAGPATLTVARVSG